MRALPNCLLLLFALMLILPLVGCKDSVTEPAQATVEPAQATVEPTPPIEPATTPGSAPQQTDAEAAVPEETTEEGPATGDDDDSATAAVSKATGSADDASAGAATDDAATQEGAPKPRLGAGGSATVELACSDKLDNDGDSAVDCDDTDCWSSSECEDAEGGREDGPAEGGASENSPPEFDPGEGPNGPGPPGGPGPPPGGWTEPAPEGQGGPNGEPEGQGIGCRDYAACVCGMAKRTKGEEVAGYNHSDTCRIAKAYTGNAMEEQCGHDLDNFKNALHDAEDIYKALGIKIPAACQ